MDTLSCRSENCLLFSPVTIDFPLALFIMEPLVTRPRKDN